MRSAGECRYEIQLDTRCDGAGQIAVEKIDAFPALHDPAHQFSRHRIDPNRLVGDSVGAVARIPFDDVTMDGVGFGAGEPEVRRNDLC